MTPHRTLLGAALTAVLLALAPGAAAVAAAPSPLPTQAYAKIEADKQLNVGSAAQSVNVGWTFYNGGATVPVPTNQTLVIDARDVAGIASVAVADPRCTADGQVFTCVNKDVSQQPYVGFTVRADADATLGATGTIEYTVSAHRGTGATARAKVIVGVPDLVVGEVPAVKHAKIGSRISLPLRLRNIGDLATDRRIALHWESTGGLVFDQRFSNCGYSGGDDLVQPGGRTSITCVFTTPVAAGATVELSSPLTAAVGQHVLNTVTDYSVELLEPGVQPGGGTEPGTGPALTLVPASGTGDGFESGAKGRVRVSTDSYADLAATATPEPFPKAGGWTLYLNAVNHGPATVYGIDDKSVAVIDVVLPRHTVAIGYLHAESEDSVHGPCFLWAGDTKTAPFTAGHRHYVCTVPLGIAAGKSQEFALSVKPDKNYDGAKGRATVRTGPAGLALHDPRASNDSVTFTFGTSATSTATAPSGDTMADPGTDRTALVTTGAAAAVLLGAVALVVHHRRRRSH